MEHSNSITFMGDVDTARRILMANGFALVAHDDVSMEFTGPGMQSTKQNPILGASRITLEVDREYLRLHAELGGVDQCVAS